MRWRRPPQLWRVGAKRVLRYEKDLKLLAPSEFMANRIRGEGVEVHKVLRLFVPDLGETQGTVRPSEDTLFYIGLMEQHKGLDTLVDAFAKSRDDNIRGHLREKVSRIGLDGRISLPGFLPRAEAEEIRRRAVAQVVPSVWFENAPSAILEAFSLGVPVIASNIGGLPEMATPESGSTTFPPGDSARLAEELVRLWQSKDRLDERRRMARKAYDDRFTPDIHIRGYLETISEL
jgi:glycosyltransferase involved in cell wall biosynthesis